MNFYVPSDETPSHRELSFGIPYKIDFMEDIADLTEGKVHIFRPGISCRPIEVQHEDGVTCFRIPYPSSAEDYAFAFDVIRSQAQRTESLITDDTGDTYEVPHFDAKFASEGWIKARSQWGLDVLLTQATQAFAEDDNIGCVAFEGPIRPFHLGARIITELLHGGNRLPADELFAMIRKSQYEFSEFSECRVYSFKHKESGTEFTLAIIGPDGNYIIPDVTYVALPIESTGTNAVHIPQSALPLIAPDKIEWIDELQFAFRAVDDEHWNELVSKAKEFDRPIFDA
jgi:hypothetical protein